MKTLTLQLEGALKPHHVPFLYADHHDRFQKKGITLEWQTPTSFSGDLTSLVDGDCDLAVTRPLALVNNFLTGDDIVGIARFFHSDSGVLFRTDSSVDDPSDLSGVHTVLCNGMSPDRARLLLDVMTESECEVEELNVIEADRDPVKMLYDDACDALISAGVNPEGVQMEQADFEVDFWFFDDYDIPANGDFALATSQQCANDSPNELKDFVHVLHQSVKEIEEDPDAGREVIEDNYEEMLEQPGINTLLFTSLSELTSNFSQDFQTYTAWGDFLTEHTDSGGFVDVDRLIDERFIPLDSVTF
ncbi:MAG: ABC transporter substrate-binding protein [bacterium]